METNTSFNSQILSPTITLHTPSATHTKPSSIILFCPWMGAPQRSISKYLLQLESLHPEAVILTCESFPKHIFAPQSWTSFHDLFSPAVQTILANSPISTGPTDPTGLADPLVPLKAIIFSNGGVHTLCHIAKLYQAKTQHPLPLSNTIIDSAPGSGDLSSAQRALTASLPPFIVKNPIYRVMASTLAWLFMFLILAFYTVFSIPNPVNQGRKDLNDTALFYRGTKGENGKRVYIYGPRDLLCTAVAVEASAAEARKAGWQVKLEKFEKSGHVRHAVLEPERYWEIIKREL